MRALRSICVHACILALAGLLVAAERLRADEHIPAAATTQPAQPATTHDQRVYDG